MDASAIAALLAQIWLLDAPGEGVAGEGCCEGMMGGMMFFGGWMGIVFWLFMLLFLAAVAAGLVYLVAALARQASGRGGSEDELVREIRRLREEIRRLRGEDEES